MSSGKRLSYEEKGKGVSSGPPPKKDAAGNESPLEPFSLIHRDAFRETAGLDLSQQILMCEAEERFRGEADGQSAEDDDDIIEVMSSASDETSSESKSSYEAVGSGGVILRAEDEPLVPIRFCSDGSFEEGESLNPDLIRPSVVEGQNWGNVSYTWSTRGGVKKLLQELGSPNVTFIIPRYDQRPWTPPIGYQCVYESWFQRDTRLWFPIPRLITSYCFRRDVAMTQFVNGAFRIAVALMVMAAEADISLSVRTFEELTMTQPMPDGIFTLKMRPGLGIIAGHPSKTDHWQRYYFYVKSDEFAFEEPPSNDYRVLWNHRLGSLSEPRVRLL